MREAAERTVLDLARRDPRVMLIGSDLGAGAYAGFREQCPGQAVMEGISEQYVIGLSAGLAAAGMLPYVQMISTFMVRRGFEQIFVDLGLQALPVRLLGGGGGLVYASLGPTHTALEDFALLRAVPGMGIVAPRHPLELSQLIAETVDWPGPLYFRLAKPPFAPDEGMPIAAFGKAALLREGEDALLVTTGTLAGEVLAAAALLRVRGAACAVLHFHTLHPFDAAALRANAAGRQLVVVAEEHLATGGLGSLVAETLSDRTAAPPIVRLGIPPDAGSHYGERAEALVRYGLSAQEIAEVVARALWSEP